MFMVNDEHILCRKDINPESYLSKFSICDDYKKGNPLLLPVIVQDVTMFSYLFFKLNNKPLKLFDYQDLILNDKSRFKIFRAARQIGKSLSLDIKAAYNLCINHKQNHNECIISKSLPQAMFQMRRVKSLLNSANFDWSESKGSADSMSVVTVDIKDKDGKVLFSNMLVCAPATEGSLGYDFHEVNLDEFEYWDGDIKHFYNSIIEPTIYSTKGNVSIFSNPNGSDNYVAELEQMKLSDGQYKFKTFVFNFHDCPTNTKDEFETFTTGKTRQEIESQLLAIRSISDRNYFTQDEITRSYDKNLTELNMVGKQPYFFLDIGAKHDQCVLSAGYIELDLNPNLFHLYIPIIKCYPVGYPLSRVVGMNVDNSDGWHYEKSVKDILEEWSVDGTIPCFGVDVTGNSGISPLFNAAGIYPVDVVFSGPVKSGMYQRFKWLMEKGLIHRCMSKEFDYQASHVIVKKSARGYLMIHHESESDLDDTIDSIAGLINLVDSPMTVEPSIAVFSMKPEKDKTVWSDEVKVNNG